MSYPGITPSERDIGRIASVVYGHHQGKMNVVAEVTLTANATSTTLTDHRIGATSHIGLTPLTESAATAMTSLYVSARDKGTATLTHDAAIDTDRTFSVLIIG